MAIPMSIAASAHHPSSIQTLLSSVKLGSLKPTRADGVITVDGSMTPAAAFNVLLKHQIMGAPVYDATAKEYTGFLELADLLPYLMARYDLAEAVAVTAKAYDTVNDKATHSATAAVPQLYPNSTQPTPVAPAAKSLPPAKPIAAYIDELFAAEAKAAAIAASKQPLAAATAAAVVSKPTATVISLSRKHPLVALSVDATLWDAAKALCGSSHRLCVCRVTGHGYGTQTEIVNVVSQSTVVQLLAANAAALAHELAARPMEIGSRPVRAVSEAARVVDAFRLMQDQAVPGLAVVSASHGRALVGALQPSHLKLFLSQYVSALNYEIPVAAFLKGLHQLEAAHRTHPPVGGVATLYCDSFQAPTLGQLIGVLASSRAHVAYVCTPMATIETDAKATVATSTATTAAAPDATRMTPIVTVSLGDVLRTICQYAGAATVPALPKAKVAQAMEPETTGAATMQTK